MYSNLVLAYSLWNDTSVSSDLKWTVLVTWINSLYFLLVYKQYSIAAVIWIVSTARPVNSSMLYLAFFKHAKDVLATKLHTIILANIEYWKNKQINNELIRLFNPSNCNSVNNQLYPLCSFVCNVLLCAHILNDTFCELFCIS